MLMWIINAVPFVLVHILLVISILGLSLHFILRFFPLPAIAPYSFIVHVVSIVLLASSLWFEGAITEKQYYEAKVAEYQHKVEVSEEAAKTASAKVEYVYVTQIKRIRDKQAVIATKIKDDTPKIDASCKVDPSVVDILNAAAQNITK